MVEQVKVFQGLQSRVESDMNFWLERQGKEISIKKRRHMTTVVPAAIGHEIQLTVFIYYTPMH